MLDMFWENLSGSWLGAKERGKCSEEKHNLSKNFYSVSTEPEAWIKKGPVCKS